MAPPQYSLSLDQFRQYSGKGNLIPLYREILADYEDLEREDILAALAFATRLSQVKRIETALV